MRTYQDRLHELAELMANRHNVDAKQAMDALLDLESDLGYDYIFNNTNADVVAVAYNNYVER